MTDKRPIEERIDEVVIGLADERECAEIEQMAVSDDNIAALLETARMRYGALDDTAVSAPLPQNMWARIADHLDIAEADSDVQDSGNVVAFSSRPRPSGKVWSALVGVAASLLLVAALGWTLFAPTEPYIVAVLSNENGEAVALVEGAANNTTKVTLLRPVNVPDGRVMQVWTKLETTQIVSLGLMESASTTQLKAPALPTPVTDQLYEITFEQTGGSPTGQPTGPIYGKGLAQKPI